jgi:hydrogenase expression/formation protein HypC
MCIGIPMQVCVVGEGFVECDGRNGHQRISTLLVGVCAPGEWLLTFMGDAREKISAERAAEMNAVLDMLDAVMGGNVPADFAGFELPSAMSADDMAQRYRNNDAV